MVRFGWRSNKVKTEDKEAAAAARAEEDSLSTAPRPATATSSTSNPGGLAPISYDANQGEGPNKLDQQQTNPSTPVGQSDQQPRLSIVSQAPDTAFFNVNRFLDQDTASHTSMKQAVGPELGEMYVRPDREIWETKFDCAICMLAFALDFSNIWRFPYLCYKYGGVVFLIPWIISVVFLTIPTLYLELIVGQFSREGAIGIWKLCPIFGGVGYAIVILSYFITHSYNVMLAWTMLFVAGSVSDPLPWSTCGNPWNTKDCIEIKDSMEQSQRRGMLAGKEYFEGEVLQLFDPEENKTYSILDLGAPIAINIVYLTVVYIFLIICLLLGIFRTVKIMWICVAFSCIFLGIFAYRSIPVPGSHKGLTYFLNDTSNFKQLYNSDMWVEAALHAFYSPGLGYGVHTAYASFNSFHHPIFRDLMAVVIIDALVGLLSLVVVFGFLGSTAFVTRSSMADIDIDENSNIFEIFPDAMARLPGKNFFSLIWFLLFFALTFSGDLSVLQCIVTSTKNVLHGVNDVYKTKSCIIVAVAVTISYMVGCVSLTRGGVDIFRSIDNNVWGRSLLICAFLQTVALSWFYGMDNLCTALLAMNGKLPNCWFRISWKFICPTILLLMILQSLIRTEPLVDGMNAKETEAKTIIALCVSFFPLIIVLLAALITIIRTKGPRRFLCVISPEIEHDVIRATKTGVRTTKKHWCFIGTKKQMEELKERFKTMFTASNPTGLVTLDPFSDDNEIKSRHHHHKKRHAERLKKNTEEPEGDGTFNDEGDEDRDNVGQELRSETGDSQTPSQMDLKN